MNNFPLRENSVCFDHFLTSYLFLKHQDTRRWTIKSIGWQLRCFSNLDVVMYKLNMYHKISQLIFLFFSFLFSSFYGSWTPAWFLLHVTYSYQTEDLVTVSFLELSCNDGKCILSICRSDTWLPVYTVYIQVQLGIMMILYLACTEIATFCFIIYCVL